jgi:hypothetical protein
MMIPIHSFEFSSIHFLRIEVGTNCPRGGDSGHGGRTLLKFTDLGSTDMRAAVNGRPIAIANCVEIVFGGDAECATLIQSLEFAVNVLKRQNSGFDGVKAVDIE